jgi:hypothetical protein
LSCNGTASDLTPSSSSSSRKHQPWLVTALRMTRSYCSEVTLRAVNGSGTTLQK